MLEIILAIVGVACLLAGWGWHMSPRWFRLLCRTLTVYCVLVILILLTWNWLKSYYILLIIPFLAVFLVFFWEMIPFPIIEINQPKNKFIPISNRKHIQFFKQDGIITIRIQKFSADPSGIGGFKSMKHNPESFIYPYIQEINISPLMNPQYKQNYLLLSGCLFSALSYPLQLDKPKAELFINGISIKKQPIIEQDSTTQKLKTKKSLTLYAENPNQLCNFRIYLTKKAREGLVNYFEQNHTVEVCLQISTDKYRLEVNGYKMALLNGGKLYDTR